MLNIHRFIVCALGLLTMVSSMAWGGCLYPAGASGSNPNTRYVISVSKQEVYDRTTNITWQRCPYAWFITPDGNACMQMQGNTGAWSQRFVIPKESMEIALRDQWALARMISQHHQGPSEWVLRQWTIPSQRDLATLIDHICKNPAINQEVFPNTPADVFWTSSSKGTNSHDHEFFYVVNFAGDGSLDDHEDYHAWPIRLAYKGKSPAIIATFELLGLKDGNQ